MRPLGLVGIIWSATAILCLALLLRYVLLTQEGFGINPRTIYIEQDKCPKGSFCPPGLETKQQFLCPPGRYGSEEGNTNPACNGLCDAGYTCEAGATDKRQKKCPDGFYCLPGTSLLGELRPIPCPAGSFCPEGSEKPVRCAEGIYCPPQSGSGTSQPTLSVPAPAPTSKPAPTPETTFSPENAVQLNLSNSYLCNGDSVKTNSPVLEENIDNSTPFFRYKYGGRTQQWSAYTDPKNPKAIRIISYWNRCISLAKTETANNSAVRLNNCNQTDFNTTWYYDGQKRLHPVNAPEKCLTYKNDKITIQECTSDSSQQWYSCV